jgi:3-oxoacyl-[acyl-carrier-protein] synthase II
MEPKEQRRVDDFIIYALAAATQALRDANWAPKTYEEEIESGVLIGSGIGGLQGIAETAIILHEKGPRRVSPFFIPGRLINLASGHVSIQHKLKGPNHSVVTACSTGAHAIGDAARLVALGDANVMVAGGAESAVNRLSLAGFSACRALATNFNDRPKQASRPYDKDRDGFVMGEGRARGIRARQGARREDLCGSDRLRPFRRRLSHNLARARRRRRVPLDGGGAEARRPHCRRHRLRQRPRHLDAHG